MKASPVPVRDCPNFQPLKLLSQHYDHITMSLLDAAEARKARLSALKKKKDGENGSTDGMLKTRNFDPETRTLRKHGAEDEITQDTVEKDVSGLVEKIIIDDEQRRKQELDVFNIAPKRPNWDLKREMEKKLAKLERKTQEAIHTLIRQRLAAQKGESDDLVGAMKAQQRQDEINELSDEE